MKRRDFFKIAIGGAAAAVLLPEVAAAEPTWRVSQLRRPSPTQSIVDMQDQLNRYHEEALRFIKNNRLHF